ncbi:MAG: 3'-5' exonuclease [Chitinophagales bacterium]|nr:3'-5' exonuclease [Chitinophagales bacterium]
MWLNTPLNRILFFDLETASEWQTLDNAPEDIQKLWKRKHEFIKKSELEEESSSYENAAAIYAEFGKIICISCGILQNETLRIKSYSSNNEKELLEQFSQVLSKNNLQLCGHNIKEFDVPYLCRRMLVHGIPLPACINVAGKKPWELDFIDTLQLWKFGDYKAYTSLNLLTEIFNIPSPKDDIDGSMVNQVYWKEKDLKRIVDYCVKDVVSVVRLVQKWRGENLIQDEQILMV